MQLAILRLRNRNKQEIDQLVRGTIINEGYNHFDVEGFHIIAEIAYEVLEENNLLKEIRK